MSQSEFDIIKKYFKPLQSTPDFLHLGIGDDAAVIDTSANSKLCISIDTLNEGIHFLKNSPPELIAHKALAVNLSDMAAMGARPLWFTLALSMPSVDDNWLELFSRSLASLAAEHQLTLIGGDTTRGPLSISIQIAGSSGNKLLTRNSASEGDNIYVTGALAESSIALDILQNRLSLNNNLDSTLLYQKQMMTESRVAFATELVDYANACIDISDGLVQDLGHILTGSHVGARLVQANIPVSPFWLEQGIAYDDGIDYALSGGDDYELCFTASADMVDKVMELAERHSTPVTCIGHITGQQQFLIIDNDKETEIEIKGYEHFQHGPESQ